MKNKAITVVIYFPNNESFDCEVGGENTHYGRLLEIIASSNPLAVRLIYEKGEELHAGLPFSATYEK